MTLSDRTWTTEEVRAELDALEASDSFRRAPGLVSLLRFLVEKELNGEGPVLKETLIGIEVYRRPANYDPKADGVVRVNANRLRRRLDEHYGEYPSRLRIALQPGSYRPRFEAAPPPVVESPALQPEVLVESASAPIITRRSPWAIWTSAGLLVIIVAGLLLWRSQSSQQHWTQRSLSEMTGLQQFPDFSPDNLRIAYTISEADDRASSLYIQELSSNTPVKLTTANRYETRPAWSPDGKSLAFVVRNDDQSLHVFVRPIEGSSETEIYSRAFSGPWLCAVPHLSWTPDGSEIVTTAPPSPAEVSAEKPPSLGCGLIAINVRTHSTRRITHSPEGTLGDVEPAVSPDGHTVAFLRQISYAMVEVFLTDMDGTHPRHLPLDREDFHGVAWTPDGKGLLLCARMGAEQVRVIWFDLQSNKAETIQSGAAPVGLATISRDGHHIAFTEYHQRNKILRLENNALKSVFDDGILRLDAVPSPDGKQIAYSTDRTGRNQIWISDSEGHHERQLTSSAGAGATRPTWAADGKSVVYECRDDGPSNLCLQSLNSKKSIVLVRNGSDAILPVFSKDGKRLYFTSNLTKTYEGYRQAVDMGTNGELSPEGKPEQLTIGGTDFIFEASSSRFIYLRGSLPASILVSAPATAVPVDMNHPNQAYLLHKPAPEHGAFTATPEGTILSMQQGDRYHFYLYREGAQTPTEPVTPQLLDSVDGMSWDAARHAILITTHSVPLGTLNLLSDK